MAVIHGSIWNDGVAPLGGASDGFEGTGADDIIYGYEGDDCLVGLSGNDVLDGGSGADEMRGGLGDDIYIVDNANDLVSDLDFGNREGGTDTVYTSVSFSLVSVGNVHGLFIENL